MSLVLRIVRAVAKRVSLVLLPVQATTKRAGGKRDGGVRPLGGAALGAASGDVAGAQVIEKLSRRSRGGGLGESAADVDAGVIVAAADADAAVGLDVDRRGVVELWGARAVAHLPDREEVGQASAVAGGQRSADVVVRVCEGTDDVVAVQVFGALLHVVVVRLEPFVVRGRDAVAEHVHGLGLATEGGGELLGDEHVGAIGDPQGAVDGVVIGDRDEVHAAALGQLVDLLRGRRTLG